MFIPGLCLQENSTRANAVQDDLQLLCAQERTNYFFLFPKIRRSNWNTKIRSKRANQSLFSTCSLKSLWYNVLENLTRHRTQRRRLIHAVRCLLFIVCTCSACDEVAGNACFRGRINQIWKTKGNGSKNELFVHLNMNAAFADAPAATQD